MMGSPGVRRRELRDEEVAGILAYAQRYVEYRKDYQA
jgi:carbonic anhydrase/acetyltransferase-like protein (isoleucine patch superfamily)